MAVSRTLSFFAGLSLPGLIAFAALGDETVPWRPPSVNQVQVGGSNGQVMGGGPVITTPIHGDTTIVSGCGNLEQLFLLRAIADRLGVHQ